MMLPLLKPNHRGVAAGGGRDRLRGRSAVPLVPCPKVGQEAVAGRCAGLREAG